MLNETKLSKDYKIISQLNGYLSYEAFKLFKLLSNHYAMLNKGPLLEIGVFCGKSLVGLADVFKQKTVGVDPFYDDFRDSPALEDEAKNLTQKSLSMSSEQRIEKIYNVAGQLDAPNSTSLASLIQIKRTTQATFLSNFEGKKFQLCHVDAEHTYKALSAFINASDKILAPGALIIFDDVFNPGYPGIAEAVFTHPDYKRTLWPVFYGFNKGVFLYKPKEEKERKELIDALYYEYHKRETRYSVKKMYDNTLVVYKTEEKKSAAELCSVIAKIRRLLIKNIHLKK